MRERILQAATEMFIEEGFEKTSIRNIAERIEYSPATIYLYFKDKNELFYDIHNRCFEQFFERLSQARHVAHPMERIRLMGDIFLAFAHENPEFYDLMFIMRAPLEAIGPTETWRPGFRSFELLKETIRECMDGGYMKPASVDVAAISILSMMHGMASLSIRKRLKMYPEEQKPELFRQALDNLMELVST